MNKKLIGVLIAILVVICGYLYATPYIALNSIKKAAQAGDSDTVSKYIDYPSVRQSFKDQMNAMMMKEMVNQEDGGFAALSTMLASTMVDKMIDGFVTPEGMTMMMKGKDLKDAAQSSEANSTSETKEENQAEYKTRYTSFSDFEVVIQDPNDSKAVTVKMVRDGLSWKIHKIAVPMD